MVYFKFRSNYLSFSGEIPMSMEIEILELLKGDDTIKTAKVWGDSGFLCRPYLSVFQSDSVWVMALFKSDGKWGHPDEKEGDYFISGFGTYYLEVNQDSVKGLIQNVDYDDPPQTMSIEKFVETVRQILTDIYDGMMGNYSYYLDQDYPNPFGTAIHTDNPTTSIRYQKPRRCCIALNDR